MSARRCLHTCHVAKDRSYLRFWVNGGHAWVSPAFTYPPRWHVEIPEGSDRWHSEEVTSLYAAHEIASQYGLELDVDEWTYERMVEGGLAPTERPDWALRPTGANPGTGALPGVDERPAGWAVLQNAPDFVNLTSARATALANQRGIRLRLIDESSPELITLDYSPTRLNLYIKHNRVVAASMG